MPLKAVVTDVTSLPADLQPHYTKDESGKFRLNVEAVDGFALENVVNLRSSLDKERENAKTATAGLKAFEGLDPVKAREALDKLERMKDWKPEERVREQIEQQLAALREKMGGDIKVRDEKLSKLQQRLEAALIDSNAALEIEKLGGTTQFLLPAIRQRCKVVENEAGDYELRIYDTKGNPMKTGKSNYAESATLADLVDELYKDPIYSKAFASSGKSGAGSQGSSRSGVSGGTYKISKSSIRGNNEAFRAAQEAASKAGVPLEITDD